MAIPYDRDFLLHPKEPGINRLNLIPIMECEEPLIPFMGISPRLRSHSPIPWVRLTVADMLTAAAASLPRGLVLVVFTGFRTLKMQRRSYRRLRRMFSRRHPEWPEPILRRETNRFIHPPDAIAPPGHSTGGAIDIELAYANGRQIDTFSSLPPEKSTWATFCPYLTRVARENRALLYSAMIEAGFSNCPDEWWHYSFGDCAWAARKGEPYAVYGLPTFFPSALSRAITRAEKFPPRPLRF